jgi:hypothetical protein
MNRRPDDYTFQRYLAAKRTVDDRALNHHVWETLHTQLAQRTVPTRPLTILEIGGGIGTMVERLLEDGRLPSTSYHLLDEQRENIDSAHVRLVQHAASSTKIIMRERFHIAPTHRLDLKGSDAGIIDMSLYAGDLYAFLAAAGSLKEVDLVLAHAFMDLVDIPSTLPLFTATLRPSALLYFTINFDGATILEPSIDRTFDAHIEQIYHRTMDERIINGKQSGDSRTGRHLFHQLKSANIQTLDAGSSDWVIIPHHGSYPHDEGYFLHYIIDTMCGALRDHPEIDTRRFLEWIDTRHSQIERGELVYIAHQLDYLGQFQG